MSRAGFVVAAAILTAGCSKSSPDGPRQIDLELVHIGQARLRTDKIGQGAGFALVPPATPAGKAAVEAAGDGRFLEQATFVLVDADNAGGEGAFVTLAGELTEPGGTAVGALKPQSLWIPAHGSRTFALVDTERQARPTAESARIFVRGAIIDQPPLVHVDSIKEYPDDGKLVVQGVLVNEAPREGMALVIASFHDAKGQPMTRPFDTITLEPNDKRGVQFVGPPGSTHGTIYVGEIAY